ncbi:MAG: DUF7734 family protein [Pseudanabaenaceae cyanobacterium]
MIDAQLPKLEEYSAAHRDEVLWVTVTVDGEPEEITVYRGFTSALTRPTPPDPDTPVLPSQAVLVRIARLRAPFNPAQPQYLGPPLTWEQFVEECCSPGQPD